MACDFDPKREALADIQSVRQSLLQALDQKLCRLPYELRLQIVGYLIPCFTATAVAGPCTREPRKIQVDISLNVWAQLVKVHGNIYICGLSNTNENQLPQAHTVTWYLFYIAYGCRLHS